MKDSIIELLMNLFAKSLSQLKQSAFDLAVKEKEQTEKDPYDTSTPESEAIIVDFAKPNTMRVFTQAEQLKFTKASYQFLTRLLLWNLVPSAILEIVINQLLLSDSRFVNLQETKWAIRNTLAQNLDKTQLAFFDLVLYQKEDKLTLH